MDLPRVDRCHHIALPLASRTHRVILIGLEAVWIAGWGLAVAIDVKLRLDHISSNGARALPDVAGRMCPLRLRPENALS
jgi:hypothetical protein